MQVDRSLDVFWKAARARFENPPVQPTIAETIARRAKAAQAARPAERPEVNLSPQAAASYVPPAKKARPSENAMHAVGLANVGRTAVETLNFGASIYNGAKKTIEDPKVQAQVKRAGEYMAKHKGVDADAYYAGIMGAFRNSMDRGLEMMKHATANMKMNFKLVGQTMTQDAQGFYRTGDYTQSARGAGWSVVVNSRGEATAIANGVDVSTQVDGSRPSTAYLHQRSAQSGQAVDIAA